MGGRWVIEVDLAVLSTLSQLREALGHPVILVGGRAVQCRLRLARHDTRVTIDIDVMVASELRPARAALATISASQSDPEHPCRLLGAGLDVDLLANDRDEAQRRDPGQIVDDDGLVLLVPPFADALVCDPELFTLAAGAGRVDVWLPRAGALFASKAANLFLEDRPPSGPAMVTTPSRFSMPSAHWPWRMTSDCFRLNAAACSRSWCRRSGTAGLLPKRDCPVPPSPTPKLPSRCWSPLSPLRSDRLGF